MTFSVNGEPVDVPGYEAFHAERFDLTLAAVSALAPTALVEVGGHPWVFTARLLAAGLPLMATVSAEEETCWPDPLDAGSKAYSLTMDGRDFGFLNYSANIERNWIEMPQRADCVIACEIIEHLVRAPHRMLLNCNRWLQPGGRVVLTTPNGAQFANPFRNISRSPPFRDAVYKRHNRVFSLVELVDLFETCGFEVERAEYWQVYGRTGPARLYDLLGAIPLTFFRALFTRTLFIQARKVEERTTASRLPRCCAPGDDWDFIDDPASG